MAEDKKVVQSEAGSDISNDSIENDTNVVIPEEDKD